jgi:DNA-binding NarL/FixJ family response regulator
MGERIRVLVVDDHQMLGDALGLLFSRHPMFELVGFARDAEHAVELSLVEHPDIVLMDLELVGSVGPDVTRKIRAKQPATKVIAVTSFKDPVAAARLLAAGACGYIHKTRAVEDVLDLLRRAMAGEILMPDANLAELVDELQTTVEPRPISELALRRLTPRETEILEALAAGASTLEIAERLRISPFTVQSHVKSILSKLGLHSKIEAVMLAWRRGLASSSRPSG